LTPAVTPLQIFFQVNPMHYFVYFQVVFRPQLEIWSRRNITKICVCGCFSYVL